MLQYVNSFTCSLNSDDNTLVLNFRQNEPIFEAEDDTVKIQTHIISSLIMDKTCALQLQDAISQLLATSNLGNEISK